MLDALLVFEPNNLRRLAEGVGTTLLIALVCIVFSLVGGVFMGIVMAFGRAPIKFACRLYLESIRIIPLLVWLFIVYFGFAVLFNWHMGAMTASILVFSAWGIAEMMDLTRGALTSINRHQIQSAQALGLKRSQITFYIIFPQAFLALLPSSINLFTRIIKTTSLVSLIGVVDLLKVGQQMIEINLFKMPNASFYVYGWIFIVYFLLCYPLSYWGKYLEKRYHNNRG